ncbi:hypothetical protein KKI95_04310 [Xenorhabdus bovienii]|uniref:hypothetical protein n=1 Tax=Xenorhabdus bovienii TaxID=40576 RepID=UPI0023B308EF|nr:hypothetical protein [Xenorhabdus bovienii]MDE9435181.1 hypothetical protein [Xenorhabdus bovienii]MDE9496985.1 hypothetical protein [Xenorhabdus bovienii]
MNKVDNTINKAGSHKEATITTILLKNDGEVEVSFTENELPTIITVNLYSKITGPSITGVSGTIANPESIIASMQYTGILHHYSRGQPIAFTTKKETADILPRIDSLTLDIPGSESI